jgi:hypothetical protein
MRAMSMGSTLHRQGVLSKSFYLYLRHCRF